MTPVATKTKIDSTTAKNDSTEPSSSSSRPLLPVTLLSGFLGSGKTSLLTNLLRSQTHGLRIGIIVNDIGEVNIDGALLNQTTRKHEVASLTTKAASTEKIIEMQNGCICCTLRPELVSQVAEMAAKGAIDYLVVESSGVSEPQQVAETFAPEFSDSMKDAATSFQDPQSEVDLTKEQKEEQRLLASVLAAGGLPSVSRLDTCVTVVDAANIFADFDTADFLIDRQTREEVPEEDDRTISDLLVDQIEFAVSCPYIVDLAAALYGQPTDPHLSALLQDVIVLNKLDLVTPDQIPKVLSLIKSLNPGAHIVQAQKYGVLDPNQVLNTHRFSYTKAAMSAGWLKSLQEEPIPETEEYGIGTFVYRGNEEDRRPFHPGRLWNTLKEVFIIVQDVFIDDGVEGSEDDQEMDDAQEEDDDDTAMDEDEEEDEDNEPPLDPKVRLAAKKASPTWGPLLRSKGFFWLATRPHMFGEWSSAGGFLTLTSGDRWRATLPKEEWADEPEVIKSMAADFKGPFGDRRQELVFIGMEMSKGGKDRLTKALDACLLTDEEMKTFTSILFPSPSPKSKKSKEYDETKLTDEDWTLKMSSLQEIFDEEGNWEEWKVEDHDHDHDHSEAAAEEDKMEVEVEEPAKKKSKSSSGSGVGKSGKLTKLPLVKDKVVAAA